MPNIERKLEDVVGCKWSVSVLQAIAVGVTRPGTLERHIAGISAKVLAQRLRKLLDYGLLLRQAHPEVPARTEYALSAAGEKLIAIIERIRELDTEIHAGGQEAPVDTR